MKWHLKNVKKSTKSSKINWFSIEKFVLIFNRKMMLVKINWFSIEKFVPVFNTKKDSFNRETAQFFYFLDGFSETRSIEIGGFTCFWGKNLKPVVVSLKPEILAKPKFSGFNETHHGVSSFYPQITREIANFRSTEFHWIPC